MARDTTASAIIDEMNILFFMVIKHLVDAFLMLFFIHEKNSDNSCYRAFFSSDSYYI